MQNETPKQTTETQSEQPSFHDELARSVEAAGDWHAFDPSPGAEKRQPKLVGDISNLSEEELKSQLVHSMYDYEYRTFGDLFKNNAAKNELRRLQLLKNRRQNPDEFDNRELVVTDQASTYHQYFPEVLKSTIRSAQKYEESASAVPAEIRSQMAPMEGYTKTYLSELNKSLSERVAYANAINLATHISKKVDPNGRPLSQQDEARLRERLGKLLADPKLTKESLDILGKGTVEGLLREVEKKDDIGIAVLGNNLNQRLIEILGGKCGKGVPDDFTPMVLELELIRRHYDFVFSQESALSLDATLVQAQARMRVMKEEYDQAKKDNAAFPKEKVQEYEALQKQIKNRQGELNALAAKRRELSNHIVFQTDHLAKYQMKMAGITTVQRMFADIKDVPSMTSPLPDKTPDVVKQSINRNMEARSDFHLQTMDEFLGVVDEKVMGIDFSVRVEDLSNSAFREFMHKLTGGIAHVVTLPIPELGDFNLRTKAKNSITGDLDRALGWPPGKTDFEELTDAEKANVRKKAKSVYQAILQFKYKHEKNSDGSVDFGKEHVEKEEIANFKETMGMVKDMPSASVFVEGIPNEKASDKRITRADMDAFLSTINQKIKNKTPLTQAERDKGATLYMQLFAQLNNDWGDIDPLTGFIGEYAVFMRNIDDNIGTHFATASALSTLSGKFFAWRDYLLYAIAAYFGVRGVLKLRKYMKGNAPATLRSQIEKLTAENAALRAAHPESVVQVERMAALEAKIADLEKQLADSVPGAEASKLAGEKVALEAKLATVKGEMGKAASQLRVAENSAQALRQEKFLHQTESLTRKAEQIQSMRGAERVEAWKQFFENDVRPFMKEFNEFEKISPGTRRLLVEKVMGRPLSEKTWNALEQAHKAVNPKDKFRILMESIEGLDKLPRAAQVAEVTKMKRLMQVGLAGEAPVAEALGAFGRVAQTGERLSVAARAVPNLARMESLALRSEAMVARNVKALRWGTAIPVVGAAIDGYIVQQDINDLTERMQNEEKFRSELHHALIDAGFEYDAQKNSYSREGAILHVDWETIKNLNASKLQSAKNRIAVDATAGALALSLGFINSGLGAPIGLLIAAGAITINMGIEAYEKGKAHEFIRNTEPWLLAYMGTSLTGFSEGSLLYKEWTEFMDPDMPLDVRHKILFALFMNVLKDNPERMRAITGGDFTPESLNEFFEGDFKSFVLPAYNVAMFTQEGDKHAHTRYFETGKYDLQPEPVTYDSKNGPDSYYKGACQAALSSYENHLQEMRYVLLSRELSLAMKQGRDADALEYEEMLRLLGKTKMFDASLFDASTELLEHDKALLEKSSDRVPETRTQLVLQSLIKKLEKAKSMSYFDMVAVELNKPDQSPLRVTPADIGWRGNAVPKVIRAGSLRSEAKETKEAIGRNHPFFLSYGTEKGRTGSLADKVDPAFHANVAEKRLKDLYPYQRMELAWNSSNAFVELGTEDGMKVYGMSKDGKEMLLIGRKGTSVLYKTVKHDQPEVPSWNVLDQAKIFELLDEKSKNSSRLETASLLNVLTTPNEFDDHESVRRIVLLFTDSSKLQQTEPAIQNIVDVLKNIPSGDLVSRGRFLADLRNECSAYGLITAKRTLLQFASTLYRKMEKGAYGEDAKRWQLERQLEK